MGQCLNDYSNEAYNRKALTFVFSILFGLYRSVMAVGRTNRINVCSSLPDGS